MRAVRKDGKHHIEIAEYWRCLGCRQLKPMISLKSRCMMQWKTNAWNGFCIDCCCLNSMRRVDCNDPTGLGWVRECRE